MANRVHFRRVQVFGQSEHGIPEGTTVPGTYWIEFNGTIVGELVRYDMSDGPQWVVNRTTMDTDVPWFAAGAYTDTAREMKAIIRADLSAS